VKIKIGPFKSNEDKRVQST